MRKIKCLSTLSLILFINVKANCQSKSLLETYYQHIYKAEEFIISKNYPAASKAYDSAFALYPQSFAIDRYNSSICAIKNKDYYKVFLDGKELILKGADTLFFIESKIYDSFIVSAYWNELSNFYIKNIKQNKNLSLAPKPVKSIYASDSIDTLMMAYDLFNEAKTGVNFYTYLDPYPKYWEKVIESYPKVDNRIPTIINESIKEGKIKSDIGIAMLEFIDNGKISIASDFFIYNDTLWQFDYKEIPSSKVSNLYSDNTIQSDLLRKEYYIDKPTNILNKIKYNFDKYLDSKNNIYDEFFIISPNPVIYKSIANRDLLENCKIISTKLLKNK